MTGSSPSRSSRMGPSTSVSPRSRSVCSPGEPSCTTCDCAARPACGTRSTPSSATSRCASWSRPRTTTKSSACRSSATSGALWKTSAPTRRSSSRPWDTPPAIQYAEVKGIRLALLRPPEQEDWTGVYRNVMLDITMTGQAGLANITWQLHPDDHDRTNGQNVGLRVPETAQLKLADARGKERDFLPIFDAQLAENYATVPLGGEATIGRVNVFDEPPGSSLLASRRYVSKRGSGGSRSHLTPPRWSSGMASVAWSRSSRSARSTAASAACSPTASSKAGPSTATTSFRGPDRTAQWFPRRSLVTCRLETVHVCWPSGSVGRTVGSRSALSS